jgi:quercetin dioxygenase-like cupin family protein
MTARYQLRFEEPEGWESPSKGVRQKRSKVGPAELRLLALEDSAEHPHWCEVGHAGCVVEGVLEIEFERETVRFEAGDGILIPPGAAHRHRPRAISKRVRLALVDYRPNPG